MQHRSVIIGRLQCVDHGRQHFVFNLDQVECVFSLITIGGADYRDRLADKAHLVMRNTAVIHRIVEADDQC